MEGGREGGRKGRREGERERETERDRERPRKRNEAEAHKTEESMAANLWDREERGDYLLQKVSQLHLGIGLTALDGFGSLFKIV